MINNVVEFHAYGTIFWTSQVGEALGWLGAALRTPNEESKVVRCLPTVSDLEVMNGGVYGCKIEYELKEISKASTSQTKGRCWHDMFFKTSLVQGYPTRKKSVSVKGVELPLGIMAASIGAQCVTVFQKNLFIKGFDRMLVLTARVDDICQWHYLSREDKTYISYTDKRLKNVWRYGLKEGDVDYQTWLNESRHVVGWWPNVEILVGKWPGLQFILSHLGTRTDRFIRIIRHQL